jgi:hypothetical protein
LKPYLYANLMTHSHTPHLYANLMPCGEATALGGPAQVDPPTRTVVVEVMGRHSNVITVNGDGDILSCAYQTGQAQTRVRPLSVGGAYTLPPVADGIQVRVRVRVRVRVWVRVRVRLGLTHKGTVLA